MYIVSLSKNNGTVLMKFLFSSLDDKAEFEAATQLFVANAANLMKSIKEVIKSSKSARALRNNKVSSSLNSGSEIVSTINNILWSQNLKFCTVYLYCKSAEFLELIIMSRLI